MTRDQTVAGKVVLITGATDGVGKRVAERLVESGAVVLLHGRDAAKGAAVLDELHRTAPAAQISYYNGDLASLADVRRLASHVQENEPRLDVLINNAGIGFRRRGHGERELSCEGHELRFAVNYLSHFLLTHLLLPLLRSSGPARIVSVSSAGQTPIDFDNVMLDRGYGGVRAYCQSKLAQILFTFELAEKLKGSGVTATVLHPATYMNTKIIAESGITPTSSVEEGADAIIHLAIGPDMEGRTGLYFNGLEEARADAQAYHRAARRRLWRLSEELVGVT